MPSTPSTRYTFAQLEGLWIQAGGARSKAPIMAAIALAESGGRSDAENRSNSDGSIDRGLWQINSVHGSLSTFNVQDNAKAAVKIEGTQGLRAWTTYTSGAYKKFMNGNTPPDTSLPSGSTTVGGGTNATQAGITGDLGTAIGQGFADAFKAVLQPFMSFVIWGSEILIGGSLVLVGALVFMANTDKGREVTRTIGGIAANSARLAVAPETEALPPAPVRVGTKVRRVRSKEEFESLRKSGYEGPVRHDY